MTEYDNTHSAYSHQASTQNAKNNKKINRCEEFIIMTVPKRIEFLKWSNLCFNYLGMYHLMTCTSSYRCFLCKAKHHILVHTDGYSSNQSYNLSTPDQVAPMTNTSSQNCGNLVVSNDTQPAHQSASLNTDVSIKCKGVLLTRVNTIGPNGIKIQVRALIDSGSQISLITQTLCNQLLLNCRTSHTHI